MSGSGDRDYGFETLAIHAGAQPEPVTGARQTPIFQNTSYVFHDADHAASLFNLMEPGFVYSRLANPTNAVLEERLAALEGGVGGTLVATGHAAQILALFPLMAPGCEVIAANKLYGGLAQPDGQQLQEVRLEGAVRRSGGPGEFPPGALRRHAGAFCREHRQSRRRDRRSGGDRRGRARGGRALHRRQHDGDALPVPADRIRRRHRRQLDDQVPVRQRHVAGRRGGRYRRFPVAQSRRQIPEPRPGRRRNITA